MMTNCKYWGRIPRRCLIAVMLALPFCLAGPALAQEAAHGIAMHGAPELAPGEPLPYVNPDAPQGGTITFGVLGSFDNLNPMIPRGTTAEGLRDLMYYGNLVYESLLERSRDEAFSLYGFLAEEVIVPDDRSSITFRIDPKAAFSDGEPVTAEDVVFTMELLREKGWPFQRSYYKRIESVETPDERTVTFSFPSANDRELPLILGVMPILPAHATDPETFEKTTLSPPPGTGPYVVEAVDPGRSVTFRRNRDYWGNDNPLNRGRYNADVVKFLYYRDETTMFEAFKTGEIDAFMEADASRWAQGYNFPAVRDGRIERWEVPTGQPRGMWAFAMNTRRAPFDDIRVRKAMTLLFDFEWVNQQMFFGLRDRTESYFEASELASTGTPRQRGASAPSSRLPRRRAGRHHGRHLGAAEVGRIGPRPDQHPRRARAPQRGGLAGEGRQARRRQRQALQLRAPRGAPRRRAAGARLPADAEADRHRGERALRRPRPVLRAPARLRFRHDPHLLVGLAVAGQRADGPLVERGGGHIGHAQLCRRARACGRRDGLRDAGGDRAGGLHHRRPRARPGASCGRICRPPLQQAGAVDRLFHPPRPSRQSIARGRGMGNLVGEAMNIDASALEPLKIDIVSDVMCPWCFIGKRRLEKALEAAHDVPVKVEWHPFQLDPTIPAGGKDRRKYLEDKFGSAERISEIYGRITAAGADEEIPFAFDKIEVSPNTLDAHRLIRWAGIEGLQDAVVERLFQLYFVEGANLTDHAVLVDAAKAAGMDGEVVARLLASDADLAETEAEIVHAQAIGVTGVPCFILDGKYAVSGAQPADVLEGAIRQVAQERVSAGD